MDTVRVVLGKELLRAADRAARRSKQNRSALIREALRAHLERLTVLEREEGGRRGYDRMQESAADLAVWVKVAAWPED